MNTARTFLVPKFIATSTVELRRAVWRAVFDAYRTGWDYVRWEHEYVSESRGCPAEGPKLRDGEEEFMSWNSSPMAVSYADMNYLIRGHGQPPQDIAPDLCPCTEDELKELIQ